MYLLVIEEKINDNIECLGNVYGKDLSSIYSQSKGLIIPSLYEGFGIPIIEALSSGCPIVCSDVTS